jgi:hypothetical protein
VFLTHPWFENSKYAITQVMSPTTGNSYLSIYGGNFANAGTDGSGTGYLVSIGASCTCSIKDIIPQGTFDKVYVMDTNANHVDVGIIPHSTETGIPATSYHTKQFAVTGTLTAKFARTAIINSGSTVSTINSRLPVNSEITLIAYQGGVTIQTGGNLQISANITLNTNGTITFRKIDKWQTWVVVGMYTP